MRPAREGFGTRPPGATEDRWEIAGLSRRFCRLVSVRIGNYEVRVGDPSRPDARDAGLR